MPELDWETVEIDTIDEDDFWYLLTSAAADVQEVALSVWRQLKKSDEGTGYTLIEAMVADPGDTMPMKNRLKFFRRKIQVLRKQAHLSRHPEDSHFLRSIHIYLILYRAEHSPICSRPRLASPARGDQSVSAHA